MVVRKSGVQSGIEPIKEKPTILFLIYFTIIGYPFKYRTKEAFNFYI